MAAPFSTHQLFYFFLVLLPIATHGLYLGPLIYQTCGQNFTKNAILDINIDSILLDMVAKSSLHGYAISNFANSDGCEAVYGVARCQADMSVQACSACITGAAQRIRSTCPASAEARIWYENCFLHYDTKDFIGKPEKEFPSVWMSFYAASNPKEFVEAVGGLMGAVVAETAGGSRKFGRGENHVNEELTVYGMAQCTRDLAESACDECLRNALEVMSDHCEIQRGCRIFGSSCMVRYETYKFYTFTSEDDDVTAPAPSPARLNYN